MGAKNSTQKSVEKFENIFDNKKNSKSKPEKGGNECQIKIKKEEILCNAIKLKFETPIEIRPQMELI